MNANMAKLLIWMSLLLMVPESFLAFGTQAMPRRCRYSKQMNMLQANCSHLNLREVPKGLRTNVEILDLSWNRLRHLTDHSLSAYTSLTHLYLMDNGIMSIDDGAFVRLKYLKVINLNSNLLIDFPKSILTLPRLTHFYIGSNGLTDAALGAVSQDEESNLEFLDLSRNKLTSLPLLGVLPQLKHLNLSGTMITQLTIEDLATFCSLETFDITTVYRTVEYCNCQSIRDWVKFRRIKFLPEIGGCWGEVKACDYDPSSNKFSNASVSNFDNCKNLLHLREAAATARFAWILVASCVSVFFTVLFITVFCIHRRSKRRKFTVLNSKV